MQDISQTYSQYPYLRILVTITLSNSITFITQIISLVDYKHYLLVAGSNTSSNVWVFGAQVIQAFSGEVISPYRSTPTSTNFRDWRDQTSVIFGVCLELTLLLKNSWRYSWRIIPLLLEIIPSGWSTIQGKIYVGRASYCVKIGEGG